MSWLRKNKKEEFTKYEPDVSKIKPVKEPESVEVIEEPEIVEEVENNEEPEVENSNDELEDLKRKQKEVEEKIERAKRKIESRIMVVKELPEAPIRRYKDKDGSIVDLITIEEAIGEILSILKSN